MKNLSITKKLLLINTPAMAALIILSLVFIFMMGSVNQNTQQMLYEDLFIPTSALLNADRDLYQAYVAEDALALLRTHDSAQEQSKMLKSMISGFLDKASRELTLLSEQKPLPRQSEQLESIVAVFTKSAQQEIDSLNTQGNDFRPSKLLESLVADFSKKCGKGTCAFAVSGNSCKAFRSTGKPCG
jgi:hypothetical protein